MGTAEIKSPEDLRETPAILDGISESVHRKKLGVFFIESDNRRTAFGRGYTGGTTPVNIHWKPIADLSKTGGWIAAFFIFGNEMAERMAYFGLSVNMVAFIHSAIKGSGKIPHTDDFSIFLILCLYYSVFVPISRRITGHPHGASQLQRVGIGLFISILSVAWAGGFERFRRAYAISHGYEVSFLTPMPDLSAYWLLIQYCLIGIAEVFSIVGLLEFLYEEAPDAMKSIGSAYAALAGGLGCFVASIINSIIKSVTRNPENRQQSWLSQNINTGKFDYFYWLLTVLCVINFCIFLYSANRYKYRTEQALEVRETKQNIPAEDS
ncbi:Proton-dependent oligopeptide transporter family - like 9 [Theobroma cacao]|nr:Proton-dependent oligopeptide transporter family - like 9 [Theobroma cacao]